MHAQLSRSTATTPAMPPPPPPPRRLADGAHGAGLQSQRMAGAAGGGANVVDDTLMYGASTPGAVAGTAAGAAGAAEATREYGAEGLGLDGTVQVACRCATPLLL